MSKARELANLRGTPTDHNILLQSTAGDALTAGSGTYNFFAGLNAGGKATVLAHLPVNFTGAMQFPALPLRANGQDGGAPDHQ